MCNSQARGLSSPHSVAGRNRHLVRAGAQPLVILRPRGPVMFVFDVSDTEPEEGRPRCPRRWGRRSAQTARGPVLRLFCLRRWYATLLETLVRNAVRDCVRVAWRRHGSQGSGSLRPAQGGASQTFTWGVRKPQAARVPVRYDVLIGSQIRADAQFATNGSRTGASVLRSHGHTGLEAVAEPLWLAAQHLGSRGGVHCLHRLRTCRHPLCV